MEYILEMYVVFALGKERPTWSKFLSNRNTFYISRHSRLSKAQKTLFFDFEGVYLKKYMADNLITKNTSANERYVS